MTAAAAVAAAVGDAAAPAAAAAGAVVAADAADAVAAIVAGGVRADLKWWAAWNSSAAPMPEMPPTVWTAGGQLCIDRDSYGGPFAKLGCCSGPAAQMVTGQRPATLAPRSRWAVAQEH